MGPSYGKNVCTLLGTDNLMYACNWAAFHIAGSVRDCKWWEVRVGMLLEVRDGEDFPADLLCLHCASAHHVCYVKTTNLDGARLLV